MPVGGARAKVIVRSVEFFELTQKSVDASSEAGATDTADGTLSSEWGIVNDVVVPSPLVVCSDPSVLPPDPPDPLPDRSVIGEASPAIGPVIRSRFAVLIVAGVGSAILFLIFPLLGFEYYLDWTGESVPTVRGEGN